MDDVPFYDRYGKSVYRLCSSVFYDYQGKPRGFLVGQAVYDLRGQHRGFYVNRLIRDRMGKIVGFAEGASSNGLEFPMPEIPPVPYRNLEPPQVPNGCESRPCSGGPASWSMMPLANMLVL